MFDGEEFDDPLDASPSAWREWIEILVRVHINLTLIRLPPHGGSGLKFFGCYPFLPLKSLPPHGGSGLKLYNKYIRIFTIWSPSAWREWIEIDCPCSCLCSLPSPSAWREWIEITFCH